MAKSNRGGKRTVSASGSGGGLTAQQLANATITVNATVDDNDVLVASASNVVSNFSALSEDEQADIIEKGMLEDVPDFLSKTDFQRIMYSHEIDGKPQIVSEATLDQMQGQVLYRTVNAVYDKRNDVGYSGKEIAEQIQYGDFTRFSDTGGSAYGRGLYFSNDYSGSASYGNTRGNIQKTAMVRCKLNSSAKIIDYSTARQGYFAECKKTTKFGQALFHCDIEDGISLWALSKGFNVITSSKNTSGRDTYFNVLDRSALTISDKVKATGSRW